MHPNSKYQKQTRIRRSLKGLCARCGKNKVPDDTYCNNCRIGTRKRSAIARLQKLAWNIMYYKWKSLRKEGLLQSDIFLEYLENLINEVREKTKKIKENL